MARRYLTLCVLLSLGGCVSVTQLTSSGQTVKDSDGNGLVRCEFLEEMQSSSPFYGARLEDGITDAKNKIRNRAAKAEATHVIWGNPTTSQTKYGGATAMTAKVYRCPTKEVTQSPASESLDQPASDSTPSESDTAEVSETGTQDSSPEGTDGTQGSATDKSAPAKDKSAPDLPKANTSQEAPASKGTAKPRTEAKP